MSKAKAAAATSVKIVGKKPARLGAKRVGTKIQVSQEVMSRDGTTTVVRYKTTTLPNRAASDSAKSSRAKSKQWLDDPRLPDQLVSAFSKAVKRAKSEAAKSGALK